MGPVESTSARILGEVLAPLAQGFEEALAVGVIVEDGFAAVPTVHDVAHGSGVLKAKFPRHTMRQDPVRQTRCQRPIDK